MLLATSITFTSGPPPLQHGDNPLTNSPGYVYVGGDLDRTLREHRGTFALIFMGGKWPEIVEVTLCLHWAELKFGEAQSSELKP